VNSPGGTCDQSFGADLQAALNMALAHSGDDTVRLGNGVAQRDGGFSYNSSDPVHVVGNGGRFFGPAERTFLKGTAADASNETVLKVIGSGASTISGIDVSIPGGTGTSNTGISATGSVDNVLVHPNNNQKASIGAFGVSLHGPATLTNSDVLLNLEFSSSAVVADGAATAVRDVRLGGQLGIFAGDPAGSLTVHRAEIEYTDTGVNVVAGSVSMDDVLAVTAFRASLSPSALSVAPSASDAALVANHVTLIGAATTLSGAALTSFSSGAGKANLTFRNGIITGFATRFFRRGMPGQSDITTDYSDYSPGTQPNTDTGPGAITETNHLDVPPGFVSSTDYRLSPGSALVDAGDPAGLAATEPATDLDGLPRISDGNGDCGSRRDIGAYEYTAGPRAPRAVAVATPATSPAGQTVTFDAAGSCDPDGDALTYDWTFEDGGGGPGTSFGRAFSAPGLHVGTVTVTDSTGRSTKASALATVAAPALPAFAGVSVGSGRLRVSKQRLVRVAVGCPAGVVGSCAGSLSLAGSKASFFFAPKSKHKLAVKLSKATFKKLKKRKKLAATARAVAHDGNASAHTTTAKITLLRPR
jgi:hypothetical protein